MTKLTVPLRNVAKASENGQFVRVNEKAGHGLPVFTRSSLSGLKYECCFYEINFKSVQLLYLPQRLIFNKTDNVRVT